MPKIFQLLKCAFWSRVPWAMLMLHLDPIWCLLNIFVQCFPAWFWFYQSIPTAYVWKDSPELLESLCFHKCPEGAWRTLTNDSWVLPSEDKSEAQPIVQSSLWGTAKHDLSQILDEIWLLFGCCFFPVRLTSLPWKLLLNKLLAHQYLIRICFWGTWSRQCANKYGFPLCKQLTPGENFSF